MPGGKTDMRTDFVTTRTNRKFKAFMVTQKDGKIAFEFEPRPEKPGRKTAAKTTTAAGEDAPAAEKKAAKKAAKKTAARKTAVKKTAAKKAAGKKTAAKVAAAEDFEDDPPF